MTAVNEFRQRNACRNYQQLGHRNDQCSNPCVLSSTCHNCEQIGHRQSKCPTKTSSATYRHCFEKGHIKANCLKVECQNWGKKGHTVNVRTEPEQRICIKCKEQGYISMHCSKREKKMRFHLPDAVSSTANTIDAETAEHQARCCESLVSASVTMT